MHVENRPRCRNLELDTGGVDYNERYFMTSKFVVKLQAKENSTSDK